MTNVCVMCQLGGSAPNSTRSLYAKPDKDWSCRSNVRILTFCRLYLLMSVDISSLDFGNDRAADSLRYGDSRNMSGIYPAYNKEYEGPLLMHVRKIYIWCSVGF